MKSWDLDEAIDDGGTGLIHVRNALDLYSNTLLLGCFSVDWSMAPGLTSKMMT